MRTHGKLLPLFSSGSYPATERVSLRSCLVKKFMDFLHRKRHIYLVSSPSPLPLEPIRPRDGLSLPTTPQIPQYSPQPLHLRLQRLLIIRLLLPTFSLFVAVHLLSLLGDGFV